MNIKFAGIVFVLSLTGVIVNVLAYKPSQEALISQMTHYVTVAVISGIVAKQFHSR